MKTARKKLNHRGLTLLETMVVILSLFILTLTLLATLNAPRLKTAIGCINQLKRIGSAFSVWAGDHHDRYPMSVSVTNGGAMELATQGDAEALFEVLSNQLSTPKALVCPADKNRPTATNLHARISARNASYFVNVDSTPTDPQILSGDDNFELHGLRIKPGLLMTSEHPLAWFPDRHKLYGNVVKTDGSVLVVSNALPIKAGVHLAIP